jgi:hypothetical protein
MNVSRANSLLYKRMAHCINARASAAIVARSNRVSNSGNSSTLSQQKMQLMRRGNAISLRHVSLGWRRLRIHRLIALRSGGDLSYACIITSSSFEPFIASNLFTSAIERSSGLNLPRPARLVCIDLHVRFISIYRSDRHIVKRRWLARAQARMTGRSITDNVLHSQFAKN